MKTALSVLLSLTLVLFSAAASAEEAAVERHTSQENTVYRIGEPDRSLFATPILVTSFGQSADSAMLDALLKRASVTDYTFNAVATADMIADYPTLIIAVGASSKGLGAAGISEKDETERAEAIIAAVKECGTKVICCHLGGANRRGALSDKFTGMVMEVANYFIVVEEGNADGLFSNFAQENDIPLTLIYSIVSGVPVFADLFAAEP